MRLALYYALHAKESLPKNLTVLRRHAEVFRSLVLDQCGDPFEVAAFGEGCEAWRYAETLKKELAIYAAFEVNIYQRLLEKEPLFKEFLTDLEYHMANATILREVSMHPFNELMSEYLALSEVWNRRYEALTTKKKYPLPESLSRRSKNTEKAEFEQMIYKEIEMLMQQVLTIQTISTQLEKCGDIFSEKLDKITGDNIALKLREPPV